MTPGDIIIIDHKSSRQKIISLVNFYMKPGMWIRICIDPLYFGNPDPPVSKFIGFGGPWTLSVEAWGDLEMEP